MTSLTAIRNLRFSSTLMAAQTAIMHEHETKKTSVGTNRGIVAAKKPGQSPRLEARKTSRTLAA